MIICVTANVAIDRTMIATGYGDGGVFRPQEIIVAAGGKGINVARAITILGGEPLCAGFLGGFAGQYASKLVEQEGFASRWTWLETGETRTCIILVDPEKQQTSVINEAGPFISDIDWKHFEKDLQELVVSSKLICFSGSLPPGAKLEQFSNTLQSLKQAGAQVWIDTSGSTLRTAAQTAGIHLKINNEEVGEILGHEVRSVESAKKAALTLHQRTEASVVITLGADGAIMLTEAGCWYAQPPKIDIISAVGSGDSFFAGLLTAIEKNLSTSEALKYAVAAGSANALSVGGARFEKASFEDLLSRVELKKL